ncbi:MAG: Xaa-Pro peptidase family protein, partial [Planctomycetaceae bacterium]|nr:Xaa-Pro peptidase family protein [Planctomycetaceae bacterium]
MYQQYSIRRNKIRRQVIREHLDAFLISNPINVRYLTGFTGNDSYLLIKRSGDQILSDTRFTIQIEEECPGLEVYFRASGETMPLAIARLFGKTTSGKLGLEADSLTITGLERISQAIPSWQMVPKRNFVEELRQIKDRYEIQLIRKAIDIAYQSFLDLRTFLSSERSEIEIRNELEYRMRCHGAEEKSFPSIIGVGSRAALPHGCPGLSKIAGHSHLLIDWGTIYKGYMSDLTRVLIFSAKDKKFRTVYETVLNAQ